MLPVPDWCHLAEKNWWYFSVKTFCTAVWLSTRSCSCIVYWQRLKKGIVKRCDTSLTRNPCSWCSPLNCYGCPPLKILNLQLLWCYFSASPALWTNIPETPSCLPFQANPMALFKQNCYWIHGWGASRNPVQIRKRAEFQCITVP